MMMTLLNSWRMLFEIVDVFLLKSAIVQNEMQIQSIMLKLSKRQSRKVCGGGILPGSGGLFLKALELLKTMAVPTDFFSGAIIFKGAYLELLNS